MADPIDGRGPLSRHAQAKWSRDKQLIRLGVELGEAGLRRDIKVFGGVVIHDGCCGHPESPCDCEPLVLEPRRHARGLP